jgi:hypothetical protein
MAKEGRTVENCFDAMIDKKSRRKSCGGNALQRARCKCFVYAMRLMYVPRNYSAKVMGGREQVRNPLLRNSPIKLVMFTGL